MRTLEFLFAGPLWARLLAIFGGAWLVFALTGGTQMGGAVSWQGATPGARVKDDVGNWFDTVREVLAAQHSLVFAGLGIVFLAVAGLGIFGRLSLPGRGFDVKKHDAEMAAVTMLPESRAAAIARRETADGLAGQELRIERALPVVALCAALVAVAGCWLLVPESVAFVAVFAALGVLPLALPALRARIAGALTRGLYAGKVEPDDLPDPFDRILAERIRRSAPVSHRHRA
ncbi:hypothetical protein [Frigidibacter sp. MR17.24]|uniref:hypothetical protein n=1 Tax=Frigidibacter sp. MR17.24 TaxID=3127345 RepID=UPI003012E884